MKQINIIATVGLPASGKSSWAKEQAKNDSNTVIVNRDKIREMLKGDYSLFPFGSKMESVVTDIENASIEAAIWKEYTIIVDATNLRGIERFQYLKEEFKDIFDIVIETKYFNVPVEECIRRDKNRDHTIGEKIIRGMYNRYKDKL